MGSIDDKNIKAGCSNVFKLIDSICPHQIYYW